MTHIAPPPVCQALFLSFHVSELVARLCRLARSANVVSSLGSSGRAGHPTGTAVADPVQKLGPTWPHPNSIGCEFRRREAFYTRSVAAHVELAFVLVRVQNPSRSYSRRAGFVLTTRGPSPDRLSLPPRSTLSPPSVPMPRRRKAPSTNSWPRNRVSSFSKLCNQPISVPSSVMIRTCVTSQRWRRPAT